MFVSEDFKPTEDFAETNQVALKRYMRSITRTSMMLELSQFYDAYVFEGLDFPQNVKSMNLFLLTQCRC